MSAITERRRELKREARARERSALPKLRGQVKASRASKAKRLAKCRADCKRRRARVQREAERARAQLRERIKRAKAKAREACGFCKVTATAAELDKLDRALAAVETEREAIGQLRRRAAGLVDPRGRAGGARAAELRAEAEDEVRRNVADDPDLLALWEAQRDRSRRFAATPRRTMTERYLEWVEENSHELDELRARQQLEWDREAVDVLGKWPRPTAIGKMDDRELASLDADLRRAETLAEAPF